MRRPHANGLLGLQRLAGNKAVSSLLSRPAASNAGTSVSLQRNPGELGSNDLLLGVMVDGTSLHWDFELADLGTTATEFLRTDRTQIARIEEQILTAIGGGTGKRSESQAYLQGPPVADDLRGDIQDWPAKRMLTRLPARLAARAAAVKATRLRYPLESYLALSAGISPSQIDWLQEITAMRSQPPDWETMIDASRADRFELALSVLEQEAALGAQPDSSTPLHTAVLQPLIYSKYAATDPAPSELQTDSMAKTHSEAFLATWLPKIRDVRLVPDGFDISTFAPTGDLDPVRRQLVTTYIDEAAPRTMEKFVLDAWVADRSRRMPEDFIRSGDIGKVRQAALGQLTTDFHRWARTQPGFRGAFWADVGQRAAYTALTTMFTSAHALQAFNAGLGDRFHTAKVVDLSTTEYGIAKDPFGYVERLADAARVTNGLVARLTPGASLEGNLLSWYDGIAASWSPGSQDTLGVAALLALFQALGSVKSTIEAQQTNVTKQLSRDFDSSYAKIETIIRNEAAYAEEFLSTKWVPMLKTVALEQITANRDEMKSHLTHWPQYREQAAAKYRICAHVLTDLSDRLNSGDLESIELDGKVLTKANLPELEHARDFMQGEADMLTDDSDAAEKKNDMQDAVDGFEKVRKRIQSGEYKPIDYTKAVYDAARKRLGVEWYDDYTTMGSALDRWAVVPENPFLAYAIMRWQWEEHVKELDHEFKVFVGLGLLTLASLVVPGAAGLVLAAVDIGVGIAQGVGAVQDAEALLDLAKLDDKQTVRGVTVEQARHALHTAWIGLGLNILLAGAGIATLFGRLIMKGRGAAKIPGDMLRLSELARINPVAAEKMIAQIKDLAKVEELLELTGDSLLLERMLAKTSDVKDLSFVLLHGDPHKMGELLELAGDTKTLGLVLENTPSVATAEKFMRLTDDGQGLVTLLKTADNSTIAEQLLTWTTPRVGNQILAVTKDQKALAELKATGIAPEVAAESLPKFEQAADLTIMVKKMDSGPNQIGTLLKSKTPQEIDELIGKGVAPRDIEVGLGAPAVGGRQPNFPIVKTPMTPEIRVILERYGIADLDMFKELAPHEAARINSVFGTDRLPKEARDILTKPGVEWALGGAGNSPGEFANRWEYFCRVKFQEERAAVAQDLKLKGLYKGQNLDKVTAKIMADPAKLLKIEGDLTKAREAVEQLAGKGWIELGPKTDPGIVKDNATRLTFGSDTAAAYHVQAHYDELALAESAAPGAGLAGQTAAYVGSARRTIIEGKFLGAASKDGAITYTFGRTVNGPGGVVKQLETKVIVRDNFALIATHGKPLGTKK